ncbi:MAG: DUF2330 domain-containing protein [Gemmataceae bacterium]
MPIRLGPFCALFAFALAAGQAPAACCYFSAKNQDVLQPAQKVYLTYDPAKKIETFTVQPKFEGNALDFGMVIPTPGRPKLHEMPKEFFKHLAVYTILKAREFPSSKLLPFAGGMFGMVGGFGGFNIGGGGFNIGGGFGGAGFAGGGFNIGGIAAPPPPPPVRILDAGVVGTLDYKVLEADRADALFQWLKDHKYQFAGDEATLDYYVKKKWHFTVMKIDTMAMKKNKDGSFSGEVTPTRFQFESEEFIYPLKITQISVKDKTEALFYVQAPEKMDLPGDWSYQLTWVPMVQAARGCSGGVPGGAEQWVKRLGERVPALLQRAKDLGFRFTPGQRPEPNAKGHIPTTMEWARRLGSLEIKVLKGEAPYCEKVPNVDEGFTAAEMRNPKRAVAVASVIRARLAQSEKYHPNGYAVRRVPENDIKGLTQLAGHLEHGQFITKFRKTFCRDEMNEDLVLVPAREGTETDTSEYQEVLPSSPP